MEYREISKNGLHISRLILGCEQLGGVDWGTFNWREAEQTVRQAFEWGINTYDVADVYGLGVAEERLSRALGGARHEAVIITKFGLNWELQEGRRARIFRDASPNRIKTALHNSLKRLNVDCIPVYLVHWPDNTTSIQETIECLERCKDEGKIQFYGLSNFSEELTDSAKTFGTISILELEYNLIQRSSESLLKKYHMQDIPIITYGSLAQGLLSGKYAENHQFNSADRRYRLPHFQETAWEKNKEILDKLRVLASNCNISVGQLAIAWVLNNPAITGAIVGAKNVVQLKQNIEALNARIASSDLMRLCNI